jgi:hypothetical protein
VIKKKKERNMVYRQLTVGDLRDTANGGTIAFPRNGNGFLTGVVAPTEKDKRRNKFMLKSRKDSDSRREFEEFENTFYRRYKNNR